MVVYDHSKDSTVIQSQSQQIEKNPIILRRAARLWVAREIVKEKLFWVI